MAVEYSWECLLPVLELQKLRGQRFVGSAQAKRGCARRVQT